MAAPDKVGGQITTFYSFKGGVGRTMALANVAFLAAMNDMRVLVMDWDLEAPGLDFYFRGLSDPDRARAIKNAKGVLDLATGWRDRVLSANAAEDVDLLLQEYEAGQPFNACAHNILDKTQFERGALDIIGAGSKWIGDHEPISYAQALAHFSWTEFFDHYGGGLFIERLRKWAKANYDLVLIDSRTGFADVAGICTIQLPDTVALSFIYNRQNIEGIAEVARSIYTDRGKAVTIRAVPMRTSRQGLLDESEARARAASALQRSGAFTLESARADLELLGVRAASNVPFYETIAPFAVPSARDDQLSLDYRRLAAAITGRQIEMVEIPPKWREIVSRRLAFKTVTTDYLDDLREADPIRIVDELDRLLEGAVEVELHDGGLEDDYLISLVDLTLDLESIVFDQVDHDDIDRLARKAVALVRDRQAADPVKWSLIYASFVERYTDTFEFPEDDVGMAAHVRRLDAILQGAASNPMVMVRRAHYRRRLAHLAANRDLKEALAYTEEAISLIATARDGGANPHEADDLDFLVQKAGYLERLGRREEAMDVARLVIAQTDGEARPDRRRLGGAMHLLLLRLEEDPDRAVGHLERAMEGEFALMSEPGTLDKVVQVVSRSTNRAYQALMIIQRMAPARPRPRSNPASFFGRTFPYAREYVKASAALAGMAATKPRPETASVLDSLIKANASILGLLERRSETIGVGKAVRKEAKAILSEIPTLLQVGSVASVPSETLTLLIRAADGLERLIGSADG